MDGHVPIDGSTVDRAGPLGPAQAVSVGPTDPNHLVAVWQDSRHCATGGGTVLDGVAGESLSQPSVAITRTGTTAVSFYRTNPFTGTAVGGGTFGYGMRSRPAGGSFGPFLGLSDAQDYPSPQANTSQAGFLGDYSSIAASTAAGSNVVHAVWSDTRDVGTAGRLTSSDGT